MGAAVEARFRGRKNQRTTSRQLRTAGNGRPTGWEGGGAPWPGWFMLLIRPGTVRLPPESAQEHVRTRFSGQGVAKDAGGG